LFALHIIHRYSVDGDTGGYHVHTTNSGFCCLFIMRSHNKYHYTCDNVTAASVAHYWSATR